MNLQQPLFDLVPPAGDLVASTPAIDLTSPTSEPKGVVYTKAWVVELILDLAGYRPDRDLASCYAVEPAAGEGAFLLPMVRRLLASLKAHGRPFSDARQALHAYELDERSAAVARRLVSAELRQIGVGSAGAARAARAWVTVGDYLLESPDDDRADWVIGNPPYIRYDDIPEETYRSYQRRYPTMVGRCDIYVGFLEAGLRQLKQDGALGFICADRWMRAAYGAELRRLVGEAWAMETVVEMHNAPAFEEEVSAYPAVIVVRRAPQSAPVVAVADENAEPTSLGDTSLADAVVDLADGRRKKLPGFSASRLDGWFAGRAPWPSVDPGRLRLLRSLEDKFGPLERKGDGTRVGIGVATGNDGLFITKDTNVVEEERLLPLAMAADTRTGSLEWSGHYLINPWQEDGRLVDLSRHPKLNTYMMQHRSILERRHVAARSPMGWYRTIDRVDHGLTGRRKLFFPDMKATSNPTLDPGTTYPHHNLYYVVSDTWDLEVLGGLLLSLVAQLFIEAYCVRMRGGTMRFQAQYLRRIRVPDPASLSAATRRRLRDAFGSRDVEAATAAAADAYKITGSAGL